MDAMPAAKAVVIVGTIGKSPLIDQLVKSGRLNTAGVAGKWESYVRQVVAALRRVGAQRATGRLPAPRLPRAALRALRDPERARRDERLFKRTIIGSDRRVLRVLKRLHATRGPQPRCAR